MSLTTQHHKPAQSIPYHSKHQQHNPAQSNPMSLTTPTPQPSTVKSHVPHNTNSTTQHSQIPCPSQRQYHNPAQSNPMSLTTPIPQPITVISMSLTTPSTDSFPSLPSKQSYCKRFPDQKSVCILCVFSFAKCYEEIYLKRCSSP